MLQQLLAGLPDEVQLSDLAAGWQLLARPHGQQEQASVVHRRGICAELAAIAAREISESGHLVGAVKAWQAWQDVCLKSADLRLAVMGKTFARELVELQSASERAGTKPMSAPSRDQQHAAGDTYGASG